MTDKELKKLKDDLWHAADMLRAGAHIAANKYGQPILGLIFLRYTKQADEALQSLAEWHNKNITAFEIDLKENRRKKQGWDQILATIPSWFDSSVQYKKLPSSIAKAIKQHRSIASLSVYNSKDDLFHQNVRLIIKDGKVYYLPMTRG